MRVLRDIPFAEVPVGHAAGGAGTLTLAYDAWLPEAAAPVPAVVLAFGGAFHRGSKEDDSFPNTRGTGRNTAIAEYARRFAARGLAAFSVRYRLAPEDPVPGDTPVITDPAALPLGRIAAVRAELGLDPPTPANIARAMEAAIDDVAAAARHIAAHAADYGADPARMVLGGWSAGARCALYAAYGERVPCAGVLALSGVMTAPDMAAHLAVPGPKPPVLFITAEHDLDDLGPAEMAAALGAFRAAGVAAGHLTVPGEDHWYAAEAPTAGGVSVEGAMWHALRRWTRV